MNSYFFKLGDWGLKWYTLFIIIGVIIGTIGVIKEAKRFNINKEFIINLMFWTVIMGMIGARVFFVLFSWDYYSSNLDEIYKIWEGGLAIYGAILFGGMTVVMYCKKYKISPFRVLDIMVPYLLLAQAIGRWGNFFNQEAYGPLTTYAHLKNIYTPEVIINGMFIGNNYYVPLFLYESIWCFLGFIVLLFIRRYKYVKIGQQLGTYFLWYSVFRFIIEMYRQDSLLFEGFRVAQLISVVLFIVGLAVVLIQGRKPKLEELYNDQEGMEILRF